MYDLTFALRTLMAALSFAGYSFFLTRRWHIHPLIAPAVVIPALGTVMVISGILNIMLLMVYLLCGLGLALLVYTLIINKGTKGLLHPAHLVVLAAFLWLLWRLQGAQVHNVDNFHHWLKVLRVMITRDQLPSYRTPIITFQAYPTGSASFLYYILKLTGYREDFAIIVQLAMLLTFSLPLFVFQKKGQWLSWITLAGFLAVALSRLYERDTLLVDDLQAFIGISAIAIAYYYRADLNKALICLTPISIYTVLIKNSAFFFIVITTLFLLVVLEEKRRRGRWKIAFFTFVLPSIFFFLWTRHVTQVFNSGLGNGMETKHAFNLALYLDQAQRWGLSRLPWLIGGVFGHAFSPIYFPRVLSIVTTISVIVLTIPLWLSKQRRLAARSLGLLAFAWSGYLLWELGTGLMFAVSMPYDEMEVLACYERYMMTGIVYMFGIMVISAVESVNAWPQMQMLKAKSAAAILCFLCSLLPVYYSGFPSQWTVPFYLNPVRSYFATLKEKYDFPIYGGKYLLITDNSNEYGELNKFLETDFLADDMAALSTKDTRRNPDELLTTAIDIASRVDYLMILTENEEIMDGLADAMDKGAFYHMRVFLDLDEVLQ